MQLSKLHKRFRELSTPMEPQPTGETPKLHKLNDIRIIAFDFYGTLFISGVGDIGVDDGNFDADVLRFVFESSGVSLTNPTAAKEGFNLYNRIVEQSINEAKNKGIEYPEPDIREIWKGVLWELKEKKLADFIESADLFEHISVEFESRMNPVWPMPGVRETLETIKGQGFIQGIISNSQFYTPVVLESLTNQSLEELGFSDELLHWSFEEEIKKPALSFYRGFLEKTAAYDATIKPEQILYIGNDMLKDVYPAHTLGMKTALFAGDKRSLKWRRDDPKCKNIEPDLVLTELKQILECLDIPEF